MFYADAVLQPGARIELAPEYEERSLYVLEGLIAVRDRSFVAGQMVMLHSDATVVAATDGPSRLLTLEARAIGWSEAFIVELRVEFG
jgi:redox-sensitive bicupin YhaK (pirin superfamily)